MSEATPNSTARRIERLVNSLNELRMRRGDQVTLRVIDLAEAITHEATRSQQFSSRLSTPSNEDKAAPRRSRRDRGPVDPFVLYDEGGETQLRQGLSDLTLEQLRDVLAEHRLDQDRLAMRWKDRERIINRIVERVTERAIKGWAFRE